jgi:response regulator NasT
MKTVIVAITNTLLANWVTNVLQRAGYGIEYTCKTGGEVTRIAEFCTSMTVVGGFQFPDMTAEELTFLLKGRLAMVTILLPHQRDLVAGTEMNTVPYPLSPADLLKAIELTEQNTAKQLINAGFASGGKGPKTERPAEEKLMILKAKNKLMEKYEMTESQAHRFLQKSSMDRGLRLIDAARKVLDNTMDF